MKALQRDRAYWWLIAGAGFGMAIIGRSEYLYALPLLAAYLFSLKRRILPDAIKKSLVFLEVLAFNDGIYNHESNLKLGKHFRKKHSGLWTLTAATILTCWLPILKYSKYQL